MSEEHYMDMVETHKFIIEMEISIPRFLTKKESLVYKTPRERVEELINKIYYQENHLEIRCRIVEEIQTK